MKIILIAGAIFLIGAMGFFLFGRKPKIMNAPPKNDTILLFGDSLAEGVGATEGNDLASRLETDLKKPVLNYGKSGDTTRDALERIWETADENPGMVIVILGGNDVLRKIPKEETFKNLEKIITFFQDDGATVVLVGVRSGLLGDGRGDDFSALAKKTGAFYVSDILKDVFADSRYMSDAVHPNDAGYALIEKRLSSIIVELFEK